MPAPLEEAALNEHLDAFIGESRSAVKDIHDDYDLWLSLFRGDEHWPNRRPKHRITFTYNKIGKAVRMIAGLMTDTKPNMEIRAGARGLERVAEVQTKTIGALWDEQAFSEVMAYRGLPMAMIFGSCPFHIFYDWTLDGGRGDIAFEPIDPRSFFLDPAVIHPAQMRQAEYAGYQTVMSINKLRRIFGDKAKRVEPDPAVSRFIDHIGGMQRGSVQSPVQLNVLKQGQIKSSAVDRARVQYFWHQDMRTVAELPPQMQEEAFKKGLQPTDLAFPNGRITVRAGSNRVILRDRNSDYIDGEPPFEMFSWDIEIEHAWGVSLVKMLRSLQDILNKLGSAVTENAIKMNNSIWIGDKDALEKEEWNELSDAPGLLVKLRFGRTLRRESPPALPGSVFQMIQFLSLAMDDIVGLMEVSQGRRPVGISSAPAIEALMLAAHTLIRLWSRAYESFLKRMGQKLIARVFQFYTRDRMLHLHGPGDDVEEYAFERQKLRDAIYLDNKGDPLMEEDKEGNKRERRFDPFRDFRDFRLLVTPASSLAVTRMQRAVIARILRQDGLVPGEDVLKVMEWPDPVGTMQRAKKELIEMSSLGLLLGGGRDQGSSGTRRIRVPRQMPQQGQAA